MRGTRDGVHLLLIWSILGLSLLCFFSLQSWDYVECSLLSLPPPFSVLIFIIFFFYKRSNFLCSPGAHGRRTWPGCIQATDTYQLSVRPHLDKTTQTHTQKHTYTESLGTHCVQHCLLLMWKLFILGSHIIWLAIYCTPLCLCLAPSLSHMNPFLHVFLTDCIHNIII